MRRSLGFARQEIKLEEVFARERVLIRSAVLARIATRYALQALAFAGEDAILLLDHIFVVCGVPRLDVSCRHCVPRACECQILLKNAAGCLRALELL